MPEEQLIEELPAGPPEGGGRYRPWPPRPGIAELPAFLSHGFTREAAAELFRLRDRVHALESQLLATKLYGGGYVPPRYWPNELPPFEAGYSTAFSGELKGPVWGHSVDQLIALLEALLATLRHKPNPAEIPAELQER